MKHETARRPVWVEGMQQISCLGTGADALVRLESEGAAYWERFGSGASASADFDYELIAGRLGGAESRQMDQLTKCTVACAELALQASPEQCSPDRSGIIVGSAFGCTTSNHQYLAALISAGPRRTSPIVFRNTVSNAAAGHLSIAFRFTGSNSVLNSGMVSGLQALAFAYEEIAGGNCDLVLSGASDVVSALVRKRFALHNKQYGRTTLPLMDGACLLTLRSERTNNEVCWRLAGYGMGFLPLEKPETVFAAVMNRALQSAGIPSGNEVDILQLHGELSDYWVRSSPDESVKAAAEQMIIGTRKLPFPENTAVPAMLSLTASLLALRKRRLHGLFSEQGAERVLKVSPRYVLFAALGGDGNVVVLVLACSERHTASEGARK